MNSSPILIYIFSIYSIGFLLKTKSRNEFLIIFTIFLFLLQFGSFPNRILAIIESPVNIRPMDIALLLLLFFVFHEKYSKRNSVPIAFGNRYIAFFFGVVILYTLVGVVRFGYAGISEFRSVFFYVIILMFISVNIKYSEIIPIVKSISTYLMPLILLVPINLILTGNYEINLSNRQFNAFIYETVTVGFLAGILYFQYIDRSFKLVWYLLPVYIAMVPYCSHRTVWAIVFATFPIILFWIKKKNYLIFGTVLGIAFALYMQVDPSFLEKRLTAFTDFANDPTGSWRLLIWQTVIEQATFWGKGLGARFLVYAPKIGWNASAGAHNGFIQVLYYSGYLGTTLLIVFISYIITKFYINIPRNKNIANKLIYQIGFLLSIALVLYMIGYGPDLISWYFIGFGLKLSYFQNRRTYRFGKQLPQNFYRYPVLQ